MEKSTRIFVHSGLAHLDEIFAIAILWLLREWGPRTEILRVKEVPADFDPEVDWALDIGGEYDPAGHIIDHHQADSEPGHCTASLLCRQFDPGFFEFLDRDVHPGTPSWMRTLRLVDSQGPFAFKKQYGVLPGDAWGSYWTDLFVKEGKQVYVVREFRQMLDFWWNKYQEQRELEAKAAENIRSSMLQVNQ